MMDETKRARRRMMLFVSASLPDLWYPHFQYSRTSPSSLPPSLSQVVERYPFVAMDTEFPGVVARPVGDVTAADYQYKTLKCNVDLLKVGDEGRERGRERGE